MTEEVMVTLDITLKPEAALGFARTGNAELAATREFPGFREVRIVRHKGDPCRFFFVQRWESEAAYDAYIAWRTERGEYQRLQAVATGVETNIWPQTVASACA
jgi:heme-degrading monooxygenase HmoA